VITEECKQTWDSLCKVPIDKNDCIKRDWKAFKKGTSKFDIWHWFEAEYKISVVDLLYKK